MFCPYGETRGPEKKNSREGSSQRVRTDREGENKGVFNINIIIIKTQR